MNKGIRINMIPQTVKGIASHLLCLVFNVCYLLVLRFRFVHDLNVERINLNADLFPYRMHDCGVYQPFESTSHYFHLVVHTLEDDMGYFAGNRTFFRFT